MRPLVTKLGMYVRYGHPLILGCKGQRSRSLGSTSPHHNKLLNISPQRRGLVQCLCLFSPHVLKSWKMYFTFSKNKCASHAFCLANSVPKFQSWLPNYRVDGCIPARPNPNPASLLKRMFNICYLHQNWINSSLPYTQPVHQVLSESVHNFLRYRAMYPFWPCLSMVKNQLKILVVGSGFGSSTKSNRFVLVTHPTCPQNFIQIRAHLFEISCTQTNKQTDRQRGENITSFTFR